jgi:hypothetical protein
MVQLASANDREAAALIREIQGISNNNRYQFSERIRTLYPILAKLGRNRSPLPVNRGAGLDFVIGIGSHWRGAE